MAVPSRADLDKSAAVDCGVAQASGEHGGVAVEGKEAASRGAQVSHGNRGSGASGGVFDS